MTNSKIRRILRKAVVEKIKFSFYSHKNDYSDYLFYSDNYFLVPSTYLNKALLTQSLSLTMACFASSSFDYSSKYKNGIDLLTKLEFNNIEANVDFKNKPNADSLGIVFANKKIKKYTLIVAVIRSANYESEWASNFKIGNDKNSNFHKGFFEASEIYLDSLKYYLEKHKIKGKIKLWSMGFSRGAISNNIASGRIDEMIEKKHYLFNKKIKLIKDNFYSFCFEPPRGVFYTSDYPKHEKFNNIYSVINYNDAVPKVVPRTLNCTRFGKELYLPDRINNFDFELQIDKVIDQFKLFPNYDTLGEYSISKFKMNVDSRLSKIFAGKNKYLINWTQGLYLDELLDVIASYAIISRDNYTSLFQEGIRNLLIQYYNSDFKDKDILSAINSKESDGNSEVLLFVKTIKKVLLSNRNLLFPLTSKENMKGLLSAHYPELCLAFLRSMDFNYTSNIISPNLSGRFYKIDIENIKSNVSVIAKEREIISIINGEIESNNSKYIFGIRKDNIEIYLPCDQKYSFQIKKKKKPNYKFSVFEPNQNSFVQLDIKPEEKDDRLIINI